MITEVQIFTSLTIAFVSAMLAIRLGGSLYK